MTDTVGLRPVGRTGFTVETGIGHLQLSGEERTIRLILSFTLAHIRRHFRLADRTSMFITRPTTIAWASGRITIRFTAKYDIGLRGLSFSGELGHRIFGAPRAGAPHRRRCRITPMGTSDFPTHINL